MISREERERCKEERELTKERNDKKKGRVREWSEGKVVKKKLKKKQENSEIEMVLR